MTALLPGRPDLNHFALIAAPSREVSFGGAFSIGSLGNQLVRPSLAVCRFFRPNLAPVMVVRRRASVPGKRI